MSDPARDGYTCHGRMTPITYPALAEVCAFLCKKCGVWRHAFPPAETQKRALTDSFMQRLLEQRGSK